MIQDIAPQVLRNEYFSKQPEEHDHVMVFSGNQVLMKETEGCMDFLRKKDMDRISAGYPYQYLFSVDEEDYFLYMDLDLGIKEQDMQYTFNTMASIRSSQDKGMCFVAYTAYHLYQWYRDDQYCGRCGSRVCPDSRERMLYCTVCGNQIYPKIAPAVIVAVTDGDRILLTKYAGRDYTQYALIAGFTEIGETAEETVRREVMEEVGLRVKNIRYYKTQPWGIASNLLLGYFAELDGADTIRLDEQELAVAEWVDRSVLKDMDDGMSLTREMMRIFYEGKEPG